MLGRTGRDGRLRVVYSIDNMGVGGTELNAVRTAERLDRARYDVHLVCLQAGVGPLRGRYAQAGVAVHAFPLGSLLGVNAVRQFVRLVHLLRRLRPDVVHAHDLYSNQFTVPAARLAGVPGVIASRRWWWQGLPGRARRLTHRVGFGLAHRVLANSPAVAELLEREERVPRERIVVVTNFLDESAFEASPAERRAYREAWRVRGGEVVFGIVANLTPVKDHATLLDAVALLVSRAGPPFRVVLVGDGPCRAALAEQATRLGITDRIVLAGRGQPGINFHHAFDISLLTSRSEAFPNSVLEAMAAARPVLATDVGGVRDAVAAGQTGLLVPPGSAAQLAEGMHQLATDPERAAVLGARGREVALERFSASRVLQQLDGIYMELARRAPATGPTTDPVVEVDGVVSARRTGGAR